MFNGSYEVLLTFLVLPNIRIIFFYKITFMSTFPFPEKEDKIIFLSVNQTRSKCEYFTTSMRTISYALQSSLIS